MYTGHKGRTRRVDGALMERDLCERRCAVYDRFADDGEKREQKHRAQQHYCGALPLVAAGRRAPGSGAGAAIV